VLVFDRSFEKKKLTTSDMIFMRNEMK
jgi:hypothetical protein